jgi:CHASE2 domain-containing sensor protein
MDPQIADRLVVLFAAVIASPLDDLCYAIVIGWWLPVPLPVVSAVVMVLSFGWIAYRFSGR